MNDFTFALTNVSYDNYNVKKFTKQVKTKAWVERYKSKLYRWQDRLTTANVDKKQVVGGMLHAAYGVNIGEQILANLTDDDLSKIKTNIINL